MDGGNIGAYAGSGSAVLFPDRKTKA